MDGSGKRARTLEHLRARIDRIGAHAAPSFPGNRITFGLATIDARFPGGGLAGGALHEMLGEGADTEHGVVPSQLVAGLLAGFTANQPPDRQVLWAMCGNDLYPPGLAAVGLLPHRLILAESGNSVPAVMEEALRHPGLCAVVGEIEGPFGLTASRRLQLAAEASGVTAFAIRRSRRFDDPVLLAPGAATTRWRVGVLAPSIRSGLLDDRPLWRLDLLRSRETSLFRCTVRACDTEGRLADADDLQTTCAALKADRFPVPALLADRSHTSRRIASRRTG